MIKISRKAERCYPGDNRPDRRRETYGYEPPVHASKFVCGSREWFDACDQAFKKAFRAALLEYKAERDAKQAEDVSKRLSRSDADRAKYEAAKSIQSSPPNNEAARA